MARSIVRCARMTTGRSTIFPFTAITPDPFFSASFMAANMVRGLLYSFLCGGKHLVDHLNLTGIDYRLAVKSETMNEFHLFAECLHVIKVGINGVKGVDAGGTCGHNDCLSRKTKLVAVRSALCLQIGAVILSAEAIPIILGEAVAMA